MIRHASNLARDPASGRVRPDHIDEAIARARAALLAAQQPDGHWCFELEADCTIPAEYIIMMHFMGELDGPLEGRIANYLRARQQEGGGWPLYFGGDFDISCSVKVYYALKLAGDSPDTPHMVRARAAILAHGGAARCNVFSRITLALFGQVPWRAVPFIPVEIMLFPRWFPFHLSKVSYWSRTVMVPLLILCSLKPHARNPRGVGIPELFTVPPAEERDYFPARSWLNRAFLLVDRLARFLEPSIPRWLRNRALKRAESWIIERLNGPGGLGAIFPAMVNAYEAFDCMGYAPDHPHRVAARGALERLLVLDEDSAYCQPCFPPVWDTAIAALALIESGEAEGSVKASLDWLRDRQLTDAPGDWQAAAPGLPSGGWPFQFENDYYPDIDDTSMVAWAMIASGSPDYEESITRALDWVRGMQSSNGGFAAFDVDNTYYYLNEIPFADHGALLDPPTADVSARSAGVLAHPANHDLRYRRALTACMRYLRREQEASGAWFGRWGTNYVYGTWSVLAAFELIGVPAIDPAVKRAARWLKNVQNPDGGWGEHNDSYYDPALAGRSADSTSFQTAWAMLGLMASGEAGCEEVRRGAEYLERTQGADGFWWDDAFTAPGFPRVFYLKYHGYSKYFPLWALSRYRNERARRA